MKNDSSNLVMYSNVLAWCVRPNAWATSGPVTVQVPAPMHFAAAWETPQVVLFGPTNPFHWHPRSESAIILMGEFEGPVSEFDPKQRAVPMNQISTQSVIDAMETLLSAPAAPVP